MAESGTTLLDETRPQPEATLSPEDILWGSEVAGLLGLAADEAPAAVSGTAPGGGPGRDPGPPGGDDPDGGGEDEDDTEAERARLLARLLELVPQNATAASLVPGAVGNELADVLTAASELRTRLASAPRSDFEDIEADIDSLAPGIDRVRQAATGRLSLRNRLRALVPGTKAQDVVPDATDDDLRAVLDAAGRLPTQIDAATGPELPTFKEAVDKLAEQIETAKQTVAQRGADRKKIEAERDGFVAPDGAETAETEGVRTLKEAVTAAFGDPPLSAAALTAARDKLKPLREEVERIGEQVALRKQAHDAIEQDGAKVVEAGLFDDQKQRLKTAREALALALEAPITTARNEAAATSLKALRLVADEVGAESLALGGAEGIAALCNAVGLDPAQYGTLEAALGDRKKTAALLKSFDAAAIGQLTAALGGGVDGGKKLAALVAGFGDPEKLRQAIARLDPGGQARLLALSASGLDAAGIGKIATDLGPPLLAALMGPGNDPAAARSLHDALGQDVAALGYLAKDGGFSDKPAALAALFLKGCGGKADRFVAFCKDFATPEDRAALRGIVVEGGLADAPDCLGELLATGCDGSAAVLKQMAASFDDAPKREGLQRVLSAGGLRGGDDPAGRIDPACLAQLLRNGAGPAPEPPTPAAVETKRRTDSLAALCAGLDGPACAAMKQVLQQGGLGTLPEEFSHVVGLAGKGDAAATADILSGFDSEAKRKGLAQLADAGGLKAEKALDGTVVVDPRCLGQMIALGTPNQWDHGVHPPTLAPPTDRQKGAGFATMCAQLTEADCKAVGELVHAGGLGTEPPVLGHLIGTGCRGQADEVKALGAAFATVPPGGANNKLVGLNKLVTQAGFGSKVGGTATKTKPECLGLLLGTGCGVPVDRKAPTPAEVNAMPPLRDRANLTQPQRAQMTVLFGPAKTAETLTDTELGQLPGAYDPADLSTVTEAQWQATEDKFNAQRSDAEKKGAQLAKLAEQVVNPDPAKAADPVKLSRMMTKGKLGEKPKVLANIYRFGCQDDPHDDKSKKDPETLTKLIGAFGADDAAADKLEKLVTRGGLGEEADAKKATWFGKVMRDGFTAPKDSAIRYAPAPNPIKADPAKLVALYSGFQNGNDIDKLKVMVDAMGTMPAKNGPDNEPGQAIQNIVMSCGRQPARLKLDFLDRIEARTVSLTGGAVGPGGGVTIGGITSAASLDATNLIQVASSMTRPSADPASVNISKGANSWATDLGHVVKRHHRRATVKQALPASANNNPTGLYPKMVPSGPNEKLEEFDHGKLQLLIKDGLSTIASPPRQHSQVTNHKKNYPNVASTYPVPPMPPPPKPVALSCVMQFGFSCRRPYGPHGAAYPVDLNQVYPRSGATIVSLNANDLAAVKSATGL